MRKREVQVVALLLTGLFICEIHTIVYKFFPETANVEYNLWFDRSYLIKINPLWYIYEIMGVLKNVIWCYALSKIAILVSARIHKVLLVFCIYYLTQFAFYLWNRNTAFFSNIIVYFYMVIALAFLFIPEKKAKIIHLNN